MFIELFTTEELVEELKSRGGVEVEENVVSTWIEDSETDTTIKTAEEEFNDEQGWYLKITRVNNGYILEGPNDHGVITESVIQEPETEHGEIDGGISMLWEVLEFFGLAGSRHDEKRIRIVTEPGDKYIEPGGCQP